MTTLREKFAERFGSSPRIFRAPGRVNLIGEHTDYNNGFVMPMGISFATHAAAAPREDRKVRVHSLGLNQTAKFSLDGPSTPSGQWSDYIQGVAVMLEREGVKLRGADMLIESNVPIGSGLSSSAALEVSTAMALLAVSEVTLDRKRIALACQKAENEFVGIGSGIMDQFTSCFAEPGHALMLDCRSLEFEGVPIPEEAAIVVANTMVKHELSGSEYNDRRASCEAAAAQLQVPSLRDITPGEFKHRESSLPELERKRARHVVGEIERVPLAAAAMRARNLAEFGRLMVASHESLRDDYEVSCAELDAMVEAALESPGVFGSRMTGGGFGGCTVSLVSGEVAEEFRTRLSESYQRRTGIRPDVWILKPEDGASEVVGE